MLERGIGDILAALLLGRGLLALIELLWSLVQVPITFLLNRATSELIPRERIPDFGPLQLSFLLFALGSAWFAALVYSWTHEPQVAPAKLKDKNA
jgi:hypothetical protein